MTHWPILTLHPIGIHFVKQQFTDQEVRTYRDATSREKIRLVTGKIIEIFNNTLKTDSPHYVEEQTQRRMDSWRPAEHQGFECISYLRTEVRGPSSIDQFIMGRGGTTIKEVTCHSRVVFFGRDENDFHATRIFALTTGKGYQALSMFRDIEFVRIVANAVMNSKLTKVDERPLMGAKMASSKSLEPGHEHAPSSTNLVKTKKIKGPIRPDVNLPEELQHLKGCQILMLQGGLQLQQKLEPGELTKLMAFYDHCFTNPADNRRLDWGDGIGDLLSTVLSVPFRDRPPLNLALTEQIARTITQGSPYTTTLRFCPPHRLNDYCSTVNCSIMHGEQEMENWTHRATTAEIIALLSSNEKIARAAYLEEYARLERLFKNLFFQMGEGDRRSRYPLLACFEGEVVSNNNHFYHLDGSWHTVHVDWISRCHIDFQRLLSSALILEGHEGNLPESWPHANNIEGVRDEREGIFNRQCGNVDTIICGDKACPDDIELFDLLQVGKDGEVRLYQVKEGFAGNVRVAAAQIENAGKRLKDYILNPSDTLIEDFCRELLKSQPQAHEKLMGLGGERYLSSLLRGNNTNNIIFVLAIALQPPQRGNVRQIEDELGLAKWINEPLLAPVCENLPATPREVFTLLTHFGFIKLSGQVTAKLLGVTLQGVRGKKETFEREFTPFGWNSIQKEALRESLETEVGSAFRSVIPRSAVLRLKKLLTKLGFGFQIYQIRNDEPFALPDDFITDVALMSPDEQTHLITGQEQFTNDQVTYKTHMVVDNGVSCLHAAFGRATHNNWRWPMVVGGVTPRTKLQQKLSQSQLDLKPFLLKIAQGWLKPNIRWSQQAEALKTFLKEQPDLQRAVDQYIKRRGLAEHLFTQARREEFPRLKAYIQNLTSARQLTLIVNALHEANLNPTEAKEMLTVYQMNPNLLQQDYERNRVQFIAAVKRYARASYPSDKQFKQTLDSLEIESIRQQLFEMLNSGGQIEQAYLQLLGKSSYTYGFLELDLAAHLFERQIQLFVPGEGDQMRLLCTLGDSGPQAAVLYSAQINRYFACEPT